MSSLFGSGAASSSNGISTCGVVSLGSWWYRHDRPKGTDEAVDRSGGELFDNSRAIRPSWVSADNLVSSSKCSAAHQQDQRQRMSILSKMDRANEQCFEKCVKQPQTSLTGSDEVCSWEQSAMNDWSWWIALLVTVHDAVHGCVRPGFEILCRSSDKRTGSWRWWTPTIGSPLGSVRVEEVDCIKHISCIQHKSSSSWTPSWTSLSIVAHYSSSSSSSSPPSSLQ